MPRIDERFRYPMSPMAKPEAMVRGDKYRITVLTDRLLRFEYSEEGVFEDRATRSVLHRDLPIVPYTVEDSGKKVTIRTEAICFTYFKGRPLDRDAFYCETVRDRPGSAGAWRNNGYSKQYNRKGTLRTLDFTSGAAELEDGLMSMDGFGVLDDSTSPIIAEDGLIEYREALQTDFYLFSYRYDYFGALRDYYRISGLPPLLPRYALGNMWCRNANFTQEEYLRIIDEFRTREVPLSTALVDMNWHTWLNDNVVDGWTGYTWNNEKYPNHRELLSQLHSRKLAVSLNLHPAQGVRPHEEQYREMAEAMHVKDGQPIPFDMNDPRFVDAYFKLLLHPYEEDGISFWWIDWQHGTHLGEQSIDPLLLLNHYHTADLEGRGKRSMIMSRYSGYGGQRYPVGFSGDVRMTWESLKFQPYFNACATNVGFTWWSNDIGGFNEGVRDNELYARWLQLGVFSPLCRLHSDGSEMLSKEPWSYEEATAEVAASFLRLRHALVPYLYTMNHRTHTQGLPLVTPLYYVEPKEWRPPYQEAYRNEYYFGSELLVCPITDPSDPVTRMGRVKVYLPKGDWFDFFTGVRYQGQLETECYRTLDKLPVFVKAGGIVPLSQSDRENGTDNPSALRIRIFAGADNRFGMYEDDGLTLGYQSGAYAVTTFHLTHGEQPEFRIDAPDGDRSVIPEARDYALEFNGYTPCASFRVTEDGKDRPYEVIHHDERQTLVLRGVTGAVAVQFMDKVQVAGADRKRLMEALLLRSQGNNSVREWLYLYLQQGASLADILLFAHRSEADRNLINALLEYLT